MARYDEAIWTLVRLIPPNRVMSYGQIAEVVDQEGVTARVVGRAMGDSPDDVPWWRVVNARGECSVDRGSKVPRQRRRLEAEGVGFARGRVDMKTHRWRPE